VADHVVQVPGDPQPLLTLLTALIGLTACSGRGRPLGPDPGRLGRDRHRQQPPGERQRQVQRPDPVPVGERGKPDRPDEFEGQHRPGRVLLPGGGGHEERDNHADMSETGAPRREGRGEGHPQHQHRMPAPRNQGHRADHEQHPVHRPEGVRRTEQVLPRTSGDRGPSELHREQHKRQREIPAQAQRPQPHRRAGRPSGDGSVRVSHLSSSVTTGPGRRVARVAHPRLHVLRICCRLATSADVGRKPMLARRHLRGDRPPWQARAGP
jgi:hypothetical protein